MPIPADLEPVPRDPKKLRRTAFILVGVMIFGGFFVLKAYEKRTRESADSGRPAYAVNRITPEKDLPVMRQDGSRAGICDLGGKVVAIQAVSANQSDTAAGGAEVMKRLAARYAAEADFHLITLVIDPGPAETLAATLASTAETLGARMPQWWVASTLPELLHKYLKKEFKATRLPHQADGRWVYDSSIVLIDRDRHIRRAVIPQQRGGPPYVAPFDFEQAAEWDQKGILTGTERSNAEELEAVLIRTIDQLLAEPAKGS